MYQTLIPSIRGLILDMDGVLYQETKPLGDLPYLFSEIRNKGLKFVMATNNAMRNTEEHLAKMHDFGVELEPWQIINSNQVVVELLKKYFPNGGPVYSIVSPSTKSTLEDAGFYFDEKNAQAVVVGMDRQLTYEKIETANLLVRAGKLYIGTNPDVSFPTPRGFLPGAGAIIISVTTASGVQPIFAGKPEPAMFDISMERLGTTPETTLVIGDRLETDILGGQRAKCRTGLVLSGVTSEAELEAWNPKPDLVSANIWEMMSAS